MSRAGAPPRTVADLLRAINTLWTYRADCPAWASSTTYAVGDMVSSGGAVYQCHAGGTAAQAPSSEGSFRDSAGLVWYPLFFVGERHLDMEGAPRRAVFVPTGGQIGGVLNVGAREVTADAADVEVYIWGRESGPSLDRYDDALAFQDEIIEAIWGLAVGYKTSGRYERSDARKVVTYGEQLRFTFTYQRFVSRTAVLQDAIATYGPIYRRGSIDPDRPNGATSLVLKPTLVNQPVRTG